MNSALATFERAKWSNRWTPDYDKKISFVQVQVSAYQSSLFKLIDSKEDWGEAGSMPRQLRREFAGAIYHVMNRGDRREEMERLGWDGTALRQTATPFDNTHNSADSHLDDLLPAGLRCGQPPKAQQ